MATARDPRIDLCIMSLQAAGIETDWEKFSDFVTAHPTSAEIADKTEAIMRQSGFGADEITVFAGPATDDIQRLVDALAAQ